MKNRVAILEDKKEIVDLYVAVLEEYEVSYGLNLNALKEVSDKESVGVLIMDHSIQGDHFDTSLSYVKDNFPNAKRLLISGHVEVLDLDLAYADDFENILPKPIDILALRSLVDDLLMQTC